MSKENKSKKKKTAAPGPEDPHPLKVLGGLVWRFLTGTIRFLWRWTCVITLMLTLITAACLLSYSKDDPAFSFVTNAAPGNWCGVVGAYVADFLYTAFGLSAWCFVLGLLMATIYSFRTLMQSWRHRSEPAGAREPRVVAFIGFVAILIGACCMEAFAFRGFGGYLPGAPGGILGDGLAFAVRHFVGYGLSMLLFAWLILFGLSLLVDFRWVDLAERIGAFVDRRIIAKLTGRATDELSGTALTSEPSGRSAAPLPAAAESAPVSAPVSRAADPAPASGTSAASTPAASVRAVPVEPLFSEPVPGRVAPSRDGRLSLEVFDEARPSETSDAKADLELMSRTIVSKLESFNIEAQVMGAQTGPVITQYWIEPAPGVKGAQIEGVKDDLRRALGVRSVRYVANVPGTRYIGLEIPNPVREMVRLKEVLDSEQYARPDKPWLLPLALGKEISGKPYVYDLAKMPHLLVAGTTGSGKSVGINSMLLTMLHHCDPTELRLVLIDPKMLEFSPYNGIPHLLTPVITDMSKAAMALKWITREMDRRYSVMARVGVRHFVTYNEKVRAAERRGTPLVLPAEDGQSAGEPLERWPYIVCVIDELADLMLTNRKEVEGEITRIAQKARAAGIHLILATQRPSTDVVTSLIKTNVGTRISFQVASALDSRIILGGNGAESLLGNGDMLFKRLGENLFTRIQGCFVSDGEVARAVDSLREYGAPEYVEGVTEEPVDEDAGGSGTRRAGEEDPLYDKAVDVVLTERRPSISFVQRSLGVGYNRAANLIEAMEAAGIVSRANSTGKRDILVENRGDL